MPNELVPDKPISSPQVLFVPHRAGTLFRLSCVVPLVTTLYAQAARMPCSGRNPLDLEGPRIAMPLVTTLYAFASTFVRRVCVYAMFGEKPY